MTSVNFFSWFLTYQHQIAERAFTTRAENFLPNRSCNADEMFMRLETHSLLEACHLYDLGKYYFAFFLEHQLFFWAEKIVALESFDVSINFIDIR